jgi:hypothetical protein
MVKIGLLSDTHSSIHPKILNFFEDCQEIWHAGDWGNISTLDILTQKWKVRGVYGNIDDAKIRLEFKEYDVFSIENVKVLIIHIGGYPGRYSLEARKLISTEKPKIFISGHSHICKVMYDKKNNLLHINPGAAGNSGFHHVITAIRFIIDGDEIKNLEVLEIPRKV